MNVRNIKDANGWFEVLQTGAEAQTAVMTLRPGGASGSKPKSHEKSEQILLVLEGEVEAEVAGEKRSLGEGDCVIVPADTPHRFANRGEEIAVTFSVYAPSEYPTETKS
ncbi:MAG: cupin domain-containing protein [Chthoniobacterales bacterium]